MTQGPTGSPGATELLAEVDRYIERNIPSSLADLDRLVRIPSISQRGEGIEVAAQAVAEMLSNTGFEAEIMPTAGSPVVYAQSPPRAKTVLCYHHYDVVAAEPLAPWRSPPFQLAERDGRLYGRGVADDKGELVSRIVAIRAVQAVTGGLPVQVKILVEGEEEVGSQTLPSFIAENRRLLAADACIWEAGSIEDGRLLLTLGFKGLCVIELRVRTMSHDGHPSLSHNLPNATWRLIWALSSIKGADESVRIAGFYDDVREPDAIQRQLLEEMPSDEEFIRDLYGVRTFAGGHTGHTYKEALFHPTANLRGITSGWDGERAISVIPSHTVARLDVSLVPDQDPEDIFHKLRRHLDTAGYEDVETRILHGEPPSASPRGHPFIELAARTAQDVYGKPPVLVPISGGGGPNYLFCSYLGMPVVTLGCLDREHHAHTSNESVSLEKFILGTRHMAHLLLAYGAS